MAARLDRGGAAVGISPFRPGAHGVGAQHSRRRGAPLLDHVSQLQKRMISKEISDAPRLLERVSAALASYLPDRAFPRLLAGREDPLPPDQQEDRQPVAPTDDRRGHRSG